MLDFLNDAEDSTGAPEAELENTELLEEVDAEDASDEEGQEDLPEDESAELDEDEESQDYIELDGEEISLDQIRELKRGSLREQDYTKKTQALAEDRKAVEQKLSSLDSALSTINSIEADVKSLLVADLEEIDLKSLRETDYPEYLRVKEEIADRSAKFDELKAKAAEASKEANAERGKELYQAMGWSDKSKYEQDVENYKSLANEMSLTEADLSVLNNSVPVMRAFLELASIKNKKPTEPPKAKAGKVKISKRSKTVGKRPSKPRTQEERLNSFFE